MAIAKKVETEKRMVIGLAAVFVAVFIAGPMKSLGLRGRPGTGSARGFVDQVMVHETLGALMQKRQREIDANLQPPARPADAPVTSAAYTAQAFRDPLRSLLPKAPPKQVASVPRAEAPVVSPLPNLLVEGLLWGGAEPQAIINRQVYRVHDPVEGATIVAIDHRGVTIDHHGARVSYTPSPAPVRSKSKKARTLVQTAGQGR